MITIHQYNSLIPGPTVIILGAIHGNEICGPQAIKKTSQQIETEKLTIKRGRLILVPISNPRAFEKNQRFLIEDLNRVFIKTKKASTYEKQLANILCPLIDQADILLDIHSTGAKGKPTVFLDFPTSANTKLAQATGIDLAIVGWPKLYQKTPNLTSYDTTTYAHRQGKDGILIECGQHQDPQAPKIAYQVIVRILGHLKIIDKKITLPKSSRLKHIKMTDLFIKEHQNDFLAKQWKNLELIKKGQAIGQRNSGKTIIAKSDKLMILPKYQAKVGKEWFYLGSYQ